MTQRTRNPAMTKGESIEDFVAKRLAAAQGVESVWPMYLPMTAIALKAMADYEQRQVKKK